MTGRSESEAQGEAGVTGPPGSAFQVVSLVPGSASATALVLDEPISFWGGVDPETGVLIDRRHPQLSKETRGTALVMESGRGSSSSSSVLAEAIHRGTSPAAILLLEPDPILALGSIVAEALYGIVVPGAVVPPHVYGTIRDGDHLILRPDGVLEVRAGHGDG